MYKNEAVYREPIEKCVLFEIKGYNEKNAELNSKYTITYKLERRKR